MSEAMIEEFKAIAHPVRFAILEALRGGERNVGELEEATGIRQPGLSQQLRVLRKAGLVDTRKEAKLVYYRLDEDKVARLAEQVAALVPERDDAQPALRTPAPGVANFARLN